MPVTFTDTKPNASWTGKSHHKLAQETRMRFVGVDGEGVTGEDGVHRYVMLGVGDKRIENPGGLHWKECFEFLYENYQPYTAFVGFFLLYDFTQIFKTMREERVWRLLTKEGIASRKHRVPNRMPHPVDCDGWQFDMLGTKRLRIRPKSCDCIIASCKCKKQPWMYVCDTGPFFQTSLLNVLDPKKWHEPIVTDKEYRIILEGKERRKTAVLDDKMREYNALENDVLTRVMETVDEGFLQMHVHLPPGKWFGPGQVAQAWMKGKVIERKDVLKCVPRFALDAARASYFGGWFETFVHGYIPGETFEYDLNSAYPYVISKLPCLEHGVWSQGDGEGWREGDSDWVMVRATVTGELNDKAYVGTMLHRDKNGRISRPLHSGGWYWRHELRAAVAAGCVVNYTVHEWVRYQPCGCAPPLRDVEALYQRRLVVGKDTPLGKGAKLGYNSMYGKFAQSVGEPVFGNPIYASLITAGCRTLILEAIASHPMGKKGVAMIATDGVYFLEKHPGLKLSEKLGEWSCTVRNNLTVFKPGVYWDDRTREAIRKGERELKFKARGINTRDFAEHLESVDEQFKGWGSRPPAVNRLDGVSEWPEVRYKTSFAMTTCLQAIRRKKWETAGYVEEGKDLVQSSCPKDKRAYVWVSGEKRRIYRTEPYLYASNARVGEGYVQSEPYKKRFGMDDPWSDESREDFGITEDGYAGDEYRELLLDGTEGIDYENEFTW